MGRPYSSDLRERIVRAVEAGSSRNAVAAQFDVSISFVVKLLQRWRDRGTIVPDQYGGWRKPILGPHVALVRRLSLTIMTSSSKSFANALPRTASKSRFRLCVVFCKPKG